MRTVIILMLWLLILPFANNLGFAFLWAWTSPFVVGAILWDGID